MPKIVSDAKLLETLLTYGNAERAAQALGISRTAIFKRLQNDDFRAEYNAAQTAIISAVALEMTAIVSDAVGTLHDVATNDVASDTARISASNALLQHCVRYVEVASIIRRLAALEEAVRNASECTAVARMVRDGKLYDELNDSEKDAYCEYWNIPRDVLEAVELAVNGSLKIPLQLKPNELLTKTVCDVENFIKSNK